MVIGCGMDSELASIPGSTNHRLGTEGVRGLPILKPVLPGCFLRMEPGRKAIFQGELKPCARSAIAICKCRNSQEFVASNYLDL